MVRNQVINYFDGANAISKRQNVAEMMKISCYNASFHFRPDPKG